VETIQPTLRNGRLVWDKINMPTVEFQERLRILREKMVERGIDIFLIYGYGFDQYANTAYLSNYIIRLPRGTLIAVSKAGEIALFFEGASRGLPSAKAITWIEDVRACKDVTRECIQYLTEKSLIPCVVGLASFKQWMPCHQLRTLLRALGDCQIKDGDAILEDMRVIKSDRESDQIRRASRIIKRVFEKLVERTLPEMNERTLEAVIYKAARLEGVEDIRILIGRPQQAEWAFRPAENLFLRQGETLILYLAVVYERY